VTTAILGGDEKHELSTSGRQARPSRCLPTPSTATCAAASSSSTRPAPTARTCNATAASKQPEHWPVCSYAEPDSGLWLPWPHRCWCPMALRRGRLRPGMRYVRRGLEQKYDRRRAKQQAVISLRDIFLFWLFYGRQSRDFFDEWWRRFWVETGHV